MDWTFFLQQTAEFVVAVQDDILEMEAAVSHMESNNMKEQLAQPIRKQKKLQRAKLQQSYLALRERREILLTSPETTPGRVDGLQNLDEEIKAIRKKLRI